MSRGKGPRSVTPIEALGLGVRGEKLGTFSLGNVRVAIDWQIERITHQRAFVDQLCTTHGHETLVAEASLTAAELTVLLQAATFADNIVVEEPVAKEGA